MQNVVEEKYLVYDIQELINQIWEFWKCVGGDGNTDGIDIKCVSGVFDNFVIYVRHLKNQNYYNEYHLAKTFEIVVKWQAFDGLGIINWQFLLGLQTPKYI